jgi:hypothetical protein
VFALLELPREGGAGMTIANRIANQPPNLDDGNTPLMFKEKEAANYLGVSESYLRKSRCEGIRERKTPAPPFVRIDGGIFYRLTDLQDWVDKLVPHQVI